MPLGLAVAGSHPDRLRAAAGTGCEGPTARRGHTTGREPDDGLGDAPDLGTLSRLNTFCERIYPHCAMFGTAGRQAAKEEN